MTFIDAIAVFALGLSILGTVLLSHRSRLGWVVAIVGSCVWFAYGCARRDWAVAANSALFILVYLYGATRWGNA